MKAFYNDNEKFVCEWTQNLIANGLISPGDVSSASIKDLEAWQLCRYDRAHFFSGIAGWDYALNLAGWPKNIRTWTGSCPCQPFSIAGKRKGTDDERHLWPYFSELIGECRPAVIFGEQVASPDGKAWLAGVQADLEAMGYLFAAADLCAAGVGAPHIRQRLYWVAYASSSRGHDGWWELQRRDETVARSETRERSGALIETQGYSDACGSQQSAISGLADANSERQPGIAGNGELQSSRQHGQQQEDRSSGGLGHTDDAGSQRRIIGRDRARERLIGPAGVGFWSRSDTILCADGNRRRIESSSFTMVDGLPASMGELRSEQIAEIEKEISKHADAFKADAGKAVHDLWMSNAAKTMDERGSGRPLLVSSPEFLLAFLRQLTKQGWTFSESISCASEKTSEGLVRSLWSEKPLAGSPYQRGLDEQRSENESSDLMHVLSSLLARCTSENWGEAFSTYASSFFPLANGVQARVGKLRAYGNAICVPVAAEFISSFMEAVGIEPIR